MEKMSGKCRLDYNFIPYGNIKIMEIRINKVWTNQYFVCNGMLTMFDENYISPVKYHFAFTQGALNNYITIEKVSFTEAGILEKNNESNYFVASVDFEDDYTKIISLYFVIKNSALRTSKDDPKFAWDITEINCQGCDINIGDGMDYDLTNANLLTIDEKIKFDVSNALDVPPTGLIVEYSYQTRIASLTGNVWVYQWGEYGFFGSWNPRHDGVLMFVCGCMFSDGTIGSCVVSNKHGWENQSSYDHFNVDTVLAAGKTYNDILVIYFAHTYRFNRVTDFYGNKLTKHV